jgi:hypothetical protein
VKSAKGLSGVEALVRQLHAFLIGESDNVVKDPN